MCCERSYKSFGRGLQAVVGPDLLGPSPAGLAPPLPPGLLKRPLSSSKIAGGGGGGGEGRGLDAGMMRPRGGAEIKALKLMMCKPLAVCCCMGSMAEQSFCQSCIPQRTTAGQRLEPDTQLPAKGRGKEKG